MQAQGRPRGDPTSLFARALRAGLVEPGRPAALLRGALLGVRAWSGARRALWSSPRAGLVATGRTPGPERTVDWHRIAVAGGLGASGGVVRLDERALARSPRLAGAALRGLVCAPAAGGVLALELDRPLAHGDADLVALAALVAALEETAWQMRADADARALILLGRRAEHLAHDLRHLLTLARLVLERGRAESRLATDLAQELGPVLAAASELCGLSLRGEPLDAGAVCELAPLLRAAARTAEASLGRDRPGRVRESVPDGLWARGELSVLSRVFVNLIANGLEAGGGAVAVCALGDGERVVVRVVDEGPGLPDAELERLNGRGTRLRRRRAERGVGLDSVRASLSELSATIAVGGAPGGGTVVEVAFPAGEHPGASDSPLAVWLVDADPLRRAAVSRILMGEGTTCRPLASVGEAHALLARCARGSALPRAVALARGHPDAGLGGLVRQARALGVPCFSIGSDVVTGFAPELRARAAVLRLREGS